MRALYSACGKLASGMLGQRRHVGVATIPVLAHLAIGPMSFMPWRSVRRGFYSLLPRQVFILIV